MMYLSSVVRAVKIYWVSDRENQFILKAKWQTELLQRGVLRRVAVRLACCVETENGTESSSLGF